MQGRHKATDPTRPVHMRLRPETIEFLAAIARREGLTYGGQPSLPQVVAWLVDQDQACQRGSGSNPSA